MSASFIWRYRACVCVYVYSVHSALLNLMLEYNMHNKYIFKYRLTQTTHAHIRRNGRIVGMQNTCKNTYIRTYSIHTQERMGKIIWQSMGNCWFRHGTHRIPNWRAKKTFKSHHFESGSVIVVAAAVAAQWFTYLKMGGPYILKRGTSTKDVVETNIKYIYKYACAIEILLENALHTWTPPLPHTYFSLNQYQKYEYNNRIWTFIKFNHTCFTI